MRKAAALRYDRTANRAPEIAASGQGVIAAEIMRIAQENRIPFYKHSELVGQLLPLPVGSEIPPGLYELVAQVLAFVLRLDEQKSGSKSGDRNS